LQKVDLIIESDSRNALIRVENEKECPCSL